MIRRDGAFSTAAVSDAVARKIDKLELALQSGPCVDAIEKQAAQMESDLTAGGRWPALTARVVAETPVRGAMSVQLPVDQSNVGALNLFSDTRNAFDDAVAGTCHGACGVRNGCHQCRGDKAKTPPRCDADWPAVARSAKPSAC